MSALMGRKLRRQLERAERLAASRRPKRVQREHGHNPMVLGSYLVFSPLQAVIDQMEQDGTLTCSPRGRPMFRDMTDGRWYDTADALAGVIEHLEMYETRHKVTLPIQSLRNLHRRLEVSMPIDEPLMESLKRDVPALQRVIALSDPDDVNDLYRQCLIKTEMEKLHGSSQTADQPVAG